MALLNCLVLNKNNNHVLLPWSIPLLSPSGVTTQQFFEDSIVKRLCDVTNIELESAALGKSKESLELSLCLESAVQLFGPYLHYYKHNIIQATPPLPNVFSILMYNQRLLSQPRVPEKLQVRTRKDKLYNDVIRHTKCWMMKV